MNQDDLERQQGNRERDRTHGAEIDRDDLTRDENLHERQREGNLGNERNRNEPDTERRPGGNRENLNR